MESVDVISGRSWLRGEMCVRTDGWEDDLDCSVVVGTVVLDRTVDEDDDEGGDCCFCDPSAAFLALLLFPNNEESENADALPLLSSFIRSCALFDFD